MRHVRKSFVRALTWIVKNSMGEHRKRKTEKQKWLRAVQTKQSQVWTQLQNAYILIFPVTLRVPTCTQVYWALEQHEQCWVSRWFQIVRLCAAVLFYYAGIWLSREFHFRFLSSPSLFLDGISQSRDSKIHCCVLSI